MSVYVLCVNSIMFILSICSIPLTLCFVFVFILFSVLPYGEIKLCIWSDRTDQTEFRTGVNDKTERLSSLEKFMQIRSQTEIWSKN